MQSKVVRTGMLALGLLALGACQRAGESEPTSKEPTSIDKSNDLKNDTPIPEQAARPSSDKNGLIDVDKEPLFIGTLVRNEVLSIAHPSEYCLDDGNLWTGASFRLGRTNLFGSDDSLAKLYGKSPIVVAGEKKPDLSSQLKKKGPCPDGYEPIQVQMRSDWISPEGGPIATRAELRSLPYIQAHSARSVSFAEFLESDEDTVRVRIRNPFSRALDGLRFQVHYEVGPGKPMAKRVQQVVSLGPGEETELSIPRQQKTESKGRRHKSGRGLHSLELTGHLGKAEIEIEVFVPHL